MSERLAMHQEEETSLPDNQWIISDKDALPTEPFNALKITIDGSLSSPMQWQEEREKAMQAKEKGLYIFWDVDLKIDALPLALDHEAQFRSLKLALEHFVDSLWHEFKDQSIGVCLYRGSARFSTLESHLFSPFSEWLQEHFSWDEFQREHKLAQSSFQEVMPSDLTSPLGQWIQALFLRNSLRDFIDLLTSHLPERFSPYLMLDLTGYPAVEQAQLIAADCFSPLNLAVQGALIPHPYLAWNGAPSEKGIITKALPKAEDFSPEKRSEPAPLALLAPPYQDYRASSWQPLKAAIHWLQSRQIPYRIIPEPYLTQSWQGLDTLLVSAKGLTANGRRQVEGFAAADGLVVFLEEPLHIEGEVPFSQFSA
ncbi:MAG: hypothetical protein K0S07_115 [Chlamydiales bacterium]|jgi:hypothetical protein|nr:hypothetical protein [Chlamydiales bacterium]